MGLIWLQSWHRETVPAASKTSRVVKFITTAAFFMTGKYQSLDTSPIARTNALLVYR